MQPRKQPRQQRSQATVTAILDTAAHILVRDGYAGFNTNRVAEQAGVSIGSLYQYFPNKTALITAVRQRHADQMKALLLTVASQAMVQPFRQMVATLVGAVMAAHRVDPRLHQVLEQEVPRQSQRADQTDWDVDLRAMLKAGLRAYAQDIHVRDLDLSCLVLVKAVDALVHATMVDDPLGVDQQDLEQEITTLVLNYLQGPASPAPIKARASD